VPALEEGAMGRRQEPRGRLLGLLVLGGWMIGGRRECPLKDGECDELCLNPGRECPLYAFPEVPLELTASEALRAERRCDVLWRQTRAKSTSQNLLRLASEARKNHM